MSTQGSIDLFNVFSSIRAPRSGSSDLILEVLGSDMGRLHVNVKFIIRLLAG
jgi:hypothetical protein